MSVKTSFFSMLCKLSLVFFLFVPHAFAGDTLSSGQWLRVNQKLDSNNGDFKLIMQGDGNLVLYRNSDNKALWSSRTHGNPGAEAIMQGDGNFVVYRNGNPLWSSQTDGNPGSRVIMQTDGNLVVYNPSNQPLWASDTRQPECRIEQVDVWGGKFELGFWQNKPGTCYEYVPLQASPAPYYHYEGIYYCIIYPTYSGKVPVEICE
ncbi:hypothetical protein [Aliikangiella coralliicola]|uniref:Bulb-type lectin domain-containing protein n=1 Tax=Aliikangiella coralliicola TaxID=2592383 RepID=A0A545UH02_9GAMM|nr:hypothetical protein [Aliikangiella coralliicola]TQV88742.1 hypothetical protein FLL46_04210 [Aliikangiella coralliicola]